MWKNRPRKNNVFSIALWIYVLARCFGFWPFSVKFTDKQKSGKVVVTFLDILWVAGAVSVYGLCCWFSFFYIDLKSQPFSQLEIFLASYTQFSAITIAMLSIILDLINRSRIWSIIVKFGEFDEEVKKEVNYFLILAAFIVETRFS